MARKAKKILTIAVFGLLNSFYPGAERRPGLQKQIYQKLTAIYCS